MVGLQNYRDIRTVLFLYDLKEGGEPRFPCGRCRQKLFEVHQLAGFDFEVVSATTSGQLWFTTVSQLLPFAFGPHDMGITL